MLNSKAKKEALEKLEKSVRRHGRLRESVTEASVELFEQRQRAAGEIIEGVEAYVNLLANSPKEFDTAVAEYRVEVNRFDHVLDDLNVAAAKANRAGKMSGAAGAVAGVGVAAFAPTAAMAIATTFGTASTGTAIGALSGAAATNAALAWLGGGALAAGGGGMAGGQALLALAGPVGWTLGGVALAGSATYVHMRNGKIAKEATAERLKIEAEVSSLKVASKEIDRLSTATREHSEGCLEQLVWLESNAPENYAGFTEDAKKRLGALINNIRSLGKLLNAEVAAP